MRVVQVNDLIRHSLFRIALPDNVEVEFKQKLLLKSNRERIVVEIKQLPKEFPNAKLSEDYKFDKILSEKEIDNFEKLQEGSIERVKKAQEAADKLKLKMRFFASSIGWENKVYAFLFTADNPVDFRELLKVLTRTFAGRIHLQRVDSRDRAEIMGGVGSCGVLNCCTTLRIKREKVSLDAVRDQGIMIRGNNKIYDTSGKLKSCLLYELPMYKKYRKYLPHMRQEVKYDGKKARVIGLDILNGRVKIQVTDTDIIEFVSVNDVDYPNKKDFPNPPIEIKIPELAIDGGLDF